MMIMISLKLVKNFNLEKKKKKKKKKNIQCLYSKSITMEFSNRFKAVVHQNDVKLTPQFGKLIIMNDKGMAGYIENFKGYDPKKWDEYFNEEYYKLEEYIENYVEDEDKQFELLYYLYELHDEFLTLLAKNSPYQKH